MIPMVILTTPKLESQCMQAMFLHHLEMLSSICRANVFVLIYGCKKANCRYKSEQNARLTGEHKLVCILEQFLSILGGLAVLG